MAIKPDTAFPGKTVAGDADYPQGSAQDITTPGDATGTPWKAIVINDIWGLLQRLLSETGITPSGSADTVQASDYFDALENLFVKPSRTASTTQTGLVELATQAETDNDSENFRAITPLTLGGRLATNSLAGVAETATQTEANAGTDTGRIITPATLAGRAASETLAGIIEIATQAEVDAGTDTARAVTPATLKDVSNFGDWQTPSYINSWVAGSLHPLRYRLFSGGELLHIIGNIEAAAATNIQFMTLPAGYRPSPWNLNMQLADAFSITVGDGVTSISMNASGGLYCILQSTGGVPTGNVYINNILPIGAPSDW